MYYTKKETYIFACPREYNAYLAFKKELKEAGITFHDLGGVDQQEIVIDARGTFSIDKDGHILDLVKNN